MCVSWGGIAVWMSQVMFLAAQILNISEGSEGEGGSGGVAHWDCSLRSDMFAGSVVAPVVLVLGGLYLCSRDENFKSDAVETVEEFIRSAKSLSINEIRRLKHKNTLIFERMKAGLPLLLAGGSLVGSSFFAGSIVQIYAMAEGSHLLRLEWDAGLLVGHVIVSVCLGMVAVWLSFRVLALYGVDALRVLHPADLSLRAEQLHVCNISHQVACCGQYWGSSEQQQRCGQWQWHGHSVAIGSEGSCS